MITEENAESVLYALKTDAEEVRAAAEDYRQTIAKAADVDHLSPRVSEMFTKQLKRLRAYERLNNGTRTDRAETSVEIARAMEAQVVGYVTEGAGDQWLDILAVIYRAAS